MNRVNHAIKVQPEERAFRPSRSGVLVLDASLNPICGNYEGIQILTYPRSPKDLNCLESFLETKIRSVLIDSRSSNKPSFLSKFVSGRRRYACRVFSLDDAPSASTQKAALVVLLERDEQRRFDGCQIAEQFRLTQREREALELLVLGLTSKEIASRMHISPSTVKVFLRIAMVKMGATTRSGLVGRILEHTVASEHSRLSASCLSD